MKTQLMYPAIFSFGLLFCACGKECKTQADCGPGGVCLVGEVAEAQLADQGGDEDAYPAAEDLEYDYDDFEYDEGSADDYDTNYGGLRPSQFEPANKEAATRASGSCEYPTAKK